MHISASSNSSTPVAPTIRIAATTFTVAWSGHYHTIYSDPCEPTIRISLTAECPSGLCSQLLKLSLFISSTALLLVSNRKGNGEQNTRCSSYPNLPKTISISCLARLRPLLARDQIYPVLTLWTRVSCCCFAINPAPQRLRYQDRALEGLDSHFRLMYLTLVDNP